MKWLKGPPATEASMATSFTRRAMLVGVVQAGLAAVLAGRMGYIAIAQNQRYSDLAESNRIQERLIPPRRGWIVDRHGQPMASNRSDFRVDLIPDQLEDPERVIAQLTRILGLAPEAVAKIREDLEAAQGFQPVPVAEHLSFEKFAEVTVRLPELPGVAPLRAFARFYPEGAAVGHLIGYVGTPNRQEYEGENRNPLLLAPGFKVGKEGLEQVMESRLRGHPGAARIEVTARGRLVRELRTRPDVSGPPLRTTIDAGLQSYAARRLGEESGACVVLDCSSGDILCMASMPAYDPNSFSDGISHSEWNMMSQDERHPLINKTLNALYPPGSTFKPAVAMAVMEAGVDPEETVSCGGGYYFGGRRFGCLGVHGPMNLHRAIAKSCNTYFYTMGRRIGIERFSAMAKRLGLGQRFGELPVVSQSYGTMPDPEWKRRRHNQDWSQSDTLNASIGQGYVILNPLQLAVMAARVASGLDLQPRLLQGRHPAPGALPFNAASFAAVRSGMDEVVNGNGTAGRSRLPFPDIRMAGKTGTAQVRNIVDANRGRAGTPWRYRDHGLFVFFAPVDRPLYAGAVVIEHGLGGARAAAPVASDVLTYLFDKDKAMQRLTALEQGWGGAIGERMARRAAAWTASGGPPPAADGTT
ncbi:penicillin-binding protein 2 [Sphingosinicella sp. LHD-64]|uniref:penicillin-binding protein 2 n=1 Tax=Sphingosinicella sp. LHD-64 TaxID=3072139 RepID=UPI00280ED389|nr:penicillin-binding protein 2 [Sphingosinicella sp. LHD-64]MDQ8755283.1 penicillin-binding protein 2 [Sphingosinicella sp. LHD-64]